MAKTGNTGITRIINAFVFSCQGIKAAYINEEAFRQEMWLCLILIPVALYAGDTVLEKTVLIASLLFVVIIELLNSALESVVDRIGNEHHDLSGRAKDMGSASVLLAIVIAIIIWLAILL